jgi:hypothetical protein
LLNSPDRQVERLDRDLMRPTRALFRHWARYRDGTLTRNGWLRLMRPLRASIVARARFIEDLVEERAGPGPSAKNRKLSFLCNDVAPMVPRGGNRQRLATTSAGRGCSCQLRDHAFGTSLKGTVPCGRKH